MYPFLVENMADEEAYIQNLNIEVNSKEVCYFMCGEKFGRILFEIFCGYNEYSNAIVHDFQKFRAPFSGKIVHIFPEQSAVI